MTDVSTVAPVVLYRNTSVLRLVGKVAVEMCALMSRMASYNETVQRGSTRIGITVLLLPLSHLTYLPSSTAQFNFILYLTA